MVAGHSVLSEPRAVRRAIGYMPDFFGVYDDMKVWEYLDFFAACYDIPPGNRRGMIDDLLALVDLAHKREDFVESLSRGMKQRLCLARTLAHDPQVLILDEPASGLDPRARVEMRELLRELKRMGKTIFFSSHILSEVADICNKIAILEAGRLVAYDDVETMKRQLQSHRIVEARVLGEIAPLAERLRAAAPVGALYGPEAMPLPGNTLRFEFSGNEKELSELLADLVASGVQVVHFAEVSSNLEDVFLQVTRGLIQ
jgi:ABC-2 type transport system ATP-binding protein